MKLIKVPFCFRFQIIHCDLAARNILLDEHRVCKLTDFGLSYQDFKYGPGNAKKVIFRILSHLISDLLFDCQQMHRLPPCEVCLPHRFQPKV